MAIFEQFPYTNLHELNLDYILETQRKQEEAFTTVIDEATEIKDQTEDLKDQTEVLKGQTEDLKDQTETLKDQTETLKDQTETLKDQTETLKGQTETIKNQLNNSLNQIYTNTQNIAINSGRIDEFTHLESGSTTGDAELADIRTGFDGTNYNTAGDAVRGQVNFLNDKIETWEAYSFINRLDLTELTEGYLANTGDVTLLSGYMTSDYMPVEEGTYIFHINSTTMGTTAGRVYYYDKNKNFLAYAEPIPVSGHQDWFEAQIININWKYARISTTNAALNTFCFLDMEEIPLIIPPYGKQIKEDIKIDYDQITNVPTENASFLYDKNWYILGDSTSHGDFTSISPPYIEDGIYSGQLQVYPYLIGNRTGMNVYNLAVNGATIATIPDQPDRYQWSVDEHYQQIQSDADIITIWLGANDMGQNVPIGTIDSSDATTFYGAYNKILSWIINNRPLAKIGIVISYWCTQAYAEASINIARKYGIPILNYYNDPTVPVSLGSQRTDVAESIKTARNQQYRVSETNAHASADFHMLSSYYIEEWLKTL